MSGLVSFGGRTLEFDVVATDVAIGSEVVTITTALVQDDDGDRTTLFAATKVLPPEQTGLFFEESDPFGTANQLGIDVLKEALAASGGEIVAAGAES